MRKKIILPSIVITGVAALVVGFASNAQAIPITVRNLDVSRTHYWFGSINRNQSHAGSAAAISSLTVSSGNLGNHVAFGYGNLHGFGHGIFGHGITTPQTPVIIQGAHPSIGLHAPLLPVVPVRLPPSAPIVVTRSGASGGNVTSVPDAGTTAELLAGSFCGLALLRKKLKA